MGQVFVKSEVQRLTLRRGEVHQCCLQHGAKGGMPDHFCRLRAIVRETGCVQIFGVRFKLRLTAAPTQFIQDTEMSDLQDPRPEGSSRWIEGGCSTPDR